MARTTNTAALVRQLDEVLEQAANLEDKFSDALAKVHPQFRAGARNLIAYVALRHIDVRALQGQLARRGLSSLGRAETNVLASVRAVRNVLCRLEFGTDCDLEAECGHFDESHKRLRTHIEDALGPGSEGRDTRIMVTLPFEAATEPDLVAAMMRAGMNIARINCAHDDEAVWQQTIDNLRRATSDTELSCRIAMDLAGPKLRTGDLRPGPGVVRLRPKRDARGRTIAARRFRFIAEDDYSPAAKKLLLPVPQKCIESTSVGDRVHLRDTRRKKRVFDVVAKGKNSLILECDKTTYVATRMRFNVEHGNSRRMASYRIGTLPGTDSPIVLRTGDRLIIHRRRKPGEPAKLDKKGAVVRPAHVACRQPEVFRDIADGDPIRLNDGKIEGVVESATLKELIVEITHAKRTGSNLRADKGINFPKSDIKLRGLTETDHANLEFVANNADAVRLSFVRKPVDIVALQSALRQFPERNIGIIVKIETMKAFKDLPRLLPTAMRHYPAAVMIARGDLAVECGWERLAEIQEEILWMCEAAEMPVIWATQVLESETKKGLPSRAEITDAAMSQRADCVMLNKGPHIVAAIEMLDDILRRMQSHQHKKSPKLRKLSISEL